MFSVSVHEADFDPGAEIAALAGGDAGADDAASRVLDQAEIDSLLGFGGAAEYRAHA